MYKGRDIIIMFDDFDLEISCEEYYSEECEGGIEE